MFKQEIAEALKAFDKYIVCVDKTPEDCEASLRSLMEKAINEWGPSGFRLSSVYWNAINLEKLDTIH